MVTGLILSFGRAMGDTLIALIITADFDSIEFKTLFVCGISLYAMTGIGVVLARGLGQRGRA